MRGASGDPRPRSPAARRRARRDLAVVAVVTSAVLLVVVAAAVVLHDRRERAGVTARPTTTSSPVRPAAVAGDALGTGDEWVTTLAAEAGVPVDARVAPGAGYLVGAPGRTIGALAATVPEDAGTVVLIGGGADAGRGALDLLRAETAAIRAARAAAPTARLVLVGPVSGSGTTTVRRTLADAAEQAGVRFVDPVAGHWLTSAQAGAAGEQPDAAGRAALVAHLAALLRGTAASG